MSAHKSYLALWKCRIARGLQAPDSNDLRHDSEAALIVQHGTTNVKDARRPGKRTYTLVYLG
ncbi:hypothetical protein CY34DRAFT_814583 [Suillus luteus UH-Slu-Lm8-n1]|uniref:Uncharacterized protein n=1 Tax=Suillus luteus UH-Slu-Lm8-n1 TaxID=930992 RepID=A0A0D0AHE9_9AGAM|nr:hypothetical protein CY34DRAFT_814583 [Suillus luteus UH-Slu-Lm8-n1]